MREIERRRHPSVRLSRNPSVLASLVAKKMLNSLFWGWEAAKEREEKKTQKNNTLCFHLHFHLHCGEQMPRLEYKERREPFGRFTRNS